MKTPHKILMALPLAMLAAGCASEPLSEQEQSQDSARERVHVVMSVLPSGNVTGENKVAGTDAENAFNDNRLYIGTFTSNGTLKYTLYADGSVNPTLKGNYYIANWGPTVSAHLPKADCENGFIAAAFSVPSYIGGTYSLGNMTDSGAAILTWPGKAANSYVWQPADDNTNNIPMAGMVNVTADYMKGYNPAIYGDSQFRLPDVNMTRAMAKIVIEDPEGIIGSATLKTPDKGSLWPKTTSWLAEDSPLPPTVPSGTTLLDQTLSEAQAVTVKDKNGDDVRAFVFYTYEQSFLNTTAGNASRRVIELTANAESGLKDNSGNPRKTTIAVAPYSEGKPDTSITAAELMTKDNGAWQGIMRNHIYTFTVQPPQQMGLFITVHVKNWDYKKIVTEL